MNDRNVGYEERLTALEKKLDSIIPALDGLNSLATELHRLVTQEKKLAEFGTATPIPPIGRTATDEMLMEGSLNSRVCELEIQVKDLQGYIQTQARYMAHNALNECLLPELIEKLKQQLRSDFSTDLPPADSIF